MTIHKLIVDWALATLNDTTPGAIPVTSKRVYSFAIDLSSAKSIAVYPGREEEPVPIGSKFSDFVRRRFHINVECRAKGTGASSSDIEVDELVGHVVRRLVGQEKGVADGKLFFRTYEGETTYEIDQADHQYCLATVPVIAEYKTRQNDPDKWD